MPDEPCFSEPPEPDDAADLPDQMSGGLVLVSTPIGNLGDMTYRAVAALRGAALVLCEDTRTTARLLRHYDIATPMAALHEHNEDARIPELLARLATGARIALVSDAGTPLVSDPGYRLVRAAIAAGVRIEAAPGANAAVTALVLSGLPPHPFLFMGFALPRAAARCALFAKIRAAEQAGLGASLVFYEAPQRLAECLADLAAVLGARRPAAVARELTKLHEETRRGSLEELAAHYAAHPARGEIVIVVGGDLGEAARDVDIDALLTERLRHVSLRDAVAEIAEMTGGVKKEIYARALALSADMK